MALRIWEQTKQREIMLERHREELIAALEKVLASANPNNSAMFQAWAFAQATLYRVKREVV